MKITNENLDDMLSMLLHLTLDTNGYFAQLKNINYIAKNFNEIYTYAYPYFVMVRSAMVKSVILGLGNLFYKSTTNSIIGLFNFAKECGIDEVEKSVQKIEKDFQSKELLVDDIFTWRDKYTAHKDDIYFHPQGHALLLEDHKIDYSDIQELIAVALNTINAFTEHYRQKTYGLGKLNKDGGINQLCYFMREHQNDERYPLDDFFLQLVKSD